MKVPPLLTDQTLLEEFLLQKLKIHLGLDDRYSREFIDLNLPFLLAREEQAAVNWVSFLENSFNIYIPDDEVDYFFFSAITQMATTIHKCVVEESANAQRLTHKSKSS